MADWRSSLIGVLDHTWRELADFQTPRAGAPGLVTIATHGQGGFPEMRKVVLRDADRDLGTVQTFSDFDTPKIREITKNPNVSVLVWQPETRTQIRLRGIAQIKQGASLKKTWDEMSERGRINYGVTPAPGTPIDTASAFSRVPNMNRLSSIIISLEEIDVVHLAKPHDIRARYIRADNWRGQWCAP